MTTTEQHIEAGDWLEQWQLTYLQETANAAWVDASAGRGPWDINYRISDALSRLAARVWLRPALDQCPQVGR